MADESPKTEENKPGAGVIAFVLIGLGVGMYALTEAKHEADRQAERARFYVKRWRKGGLTHGEAFRKYMFPRKGEK